MPGASHQTLLQLYLRYLGALPTGSGHNLLLKQRVNVYYYNSLELG